MIDHHQVMEAVEMEFIFQSHQLISPGWKETVQPINGNDGLTRDSLTTSSSAKNWKLQKTQIIILLDSVGNLALPERLVESLAESEVALALGALDKLLDLPGAGASGLIGLASWIMKWQRMPFLWTRIVRVKASVTKVKR